MSQGGECYYYADDGILYFDNPISFKLRLLHGIAFESVPEGWRKYQFATVKAVNPQNSSLSKTVVYAKSVRNGSTTVVYDNSSSTAVILFGI